MKFRKFWSKLYFICGLGKEGRDSNSGEPDLTASTARSLRVAVLKCDRCLLIMCTVSNWVTYWSVVWISSRCWMGRNTSGSLSLVYFIIIIIIISWRYSPVWALASVTICLQVSRSLALSLHSFIPIFLRSMDTSSSHLHQLSPSSSLAATWSERSMCQISGPWFLSVRVVFVSVGYSLRSEAYCRVS